MYEILDSKCRFKKKRKIENCLFLLHLRMKIVLAELYIILVYEKFYLFYLFELSMDQESSFV